MVKIREEQTAKLEEAASKGMKFGGFKNMRMSSKISLILLILVALTAILAPLIAPHDPLEIFTARQAPGNGFLFGTDDKGRDILSRMLYGGRYSLVIGFGATLFALFFGSIVGAIAAVARKSVSEARPGHHHVRPGYRPGRRPRVDPRQFGSGHHLLHRLHVHAADRAYRSREHRV